MIADQLLSSAESFLQERKVEHVVIGLSYTGVLLDDGCCGLAATLKEEIHGCPDLGQEAGRFGGKNAYHLAQGVSSPNILRSSLGLAVVNAALNRGVKSNTSPPLEALRIGAEDKVGMVGYFGPLIETVKN
ncbi:DUF364 domain-containing protein, partial [Candidatus Bipolaricaulota bacterium]|nr:DUF364 domain-containing protein [Candidatus Bipolaricaulota bacterium]